MVFHGGWGDMKNIFIAILAGRWLSVFASFLLMATAGTSYIFGLYSNDIKSSLGYDQTTLNLIDFFKDLGANIVLRLIKSKDIKWRIASFTSSKPLYLEMIAFILLSGSCQYLQ
ncbi:hypothetical protein L484_017023 [Morus notabilis]|uniref:Nodulin-like domain-containing protein n=1 Tax=Morus notabilis TaxID=981085 RepID=W9RKV8_9ROSA|nr:hypothetical protein L484_017023 [Morus notabilis]